MILREGCFTNGTPLRHAWMIIAHGSFDLLERQLRFLDSENADFYLHIDAKVAEPPLERLRSAVKRSRVCFVDRVSVSWGDFSMVEAELILMKAARAGNYDYYHLLSGVDAPLKSRTYIEGFFEAHRGKNFIHFQDEHPGREFTDRLKYYYPLQKWNIQNRAVRTALRRAEIVLERPFVDRLKKLPEGFIVQKGAQWFSITKDFLDYVLEREDFIRHMLRSTFCSDEFLMQTMIINSPFRNTLFSETYGDDHAPCLRYIDWQRGKPYTFGTEDLEELKNTADCYLFARKFSGSAPAAAFALFDHFGKEGEGR